eukprot:TRINITY_DN5109_c0_g2_i4.p1 TRINITY_DN5109_c0_g2~~TRINITY_DN5109_c0_g2_i4.p1  ORF type:complete len:511 (+),score=114.34 TRINITY_DN5109_c0_g2_i4:188-1720(+)
MRSVLSRSLSSGKSNQTVTRLPASSLGPTISDDICSKVNEQLKEGNYDKIESLAFPANAVVDLNESFSWKKRRTGCLIYPPPASTELSVIKLEADHIKRITSTVSALLEWTENRRDDLSMDLFEFPPIAKKGKIEDQENFGGDSFVDYLNFMDEDLSDDFLFFKGDNSLKQAQRKIIDQKTEKNLQTTQVPEKIMPSKITKMKTRSRKSVSKSNTSPSTDPLISSQITPRSPNYFQASNFSAKNSRDRALSSSLTPKEELNVECPFLPGQEPNIPDSRAPLIIESHLPAQPLQPQPQNLPFQSQSFPQMQYQQSPQISPQDSPQISPQINQVSQSRNKSRVREIPLESSKDEVRLAKKIIEVHNLMLTLHILKEEGVISPQAEKERMQKAKEELDLLLYNVLDLSTLLKFMSDLPQQLVEQFYAKKKNPGQSQITLKRSSVPSKRRSSTLTGSLPSLQSEEKHTIQAGLFLALKSRLLDKNPKDHSICSGQLMPFIAYLLENVRTSFTLQ